MTAFPSSGTPGAALRPRRERFLPSPRQAVVPKYVPQRRLTTFVPDGLIDPKRLSLNPLVMDKHPHQSVFDFKDAWKTAEKDYLRVQGERKRRGLATPVLCSLPNLVRCWGLNL